MSITVEHERFILTAIRKDDRSVRSTERRGKRKVVADDYGLIESPSGGGS